MTSAESTVDNSSAAAFWSATVWPQPPPPANSPATTFPPSAWISRAACLTSARYWSSVFPPPKHPGSFQMDQYPTRLPNVATAQCTNAAHFVESVGYPCSGSPVPDKSNGG